MDKYRSSLCCRTGGTASQLQYHILCLKCHSHIQKQAQQRKGTGHYKKKLTWSHKALRATELQKRKQHTPENTRGFLPRRSGSYAERRAFGAGSYLSPCLPSPCFVPLLSDKKALSQGERFQSCSFSGPSPGK